MYPEHVTIDWTSLRRGADRVNPDLFDLRSRMMMRQCSSIKFRRLDGTEISLKERYPGIPEDKFTFLGRDDFDSLLQQEKKTWTTS